MKKKSDLQTDIDHDYSWSQVKTILEMFQLEPKEFSNWLVGQTCPFVEVDGKYEIGVYGWDLYQWIEWKKGGKEPAWD